jgi:hypothetical protein
MVGFSKSRTPCQILKVSLEIVTRPGRWAARAQINGVGLDIPVSYETWSSEIEHALSCSRSEKAGETAENFHLSATKGVNGSSPRNLRNWQMIN